MTAPHLSDVVEPTSAPLAAVLRANGIVKSFGGQRVLRDVSFELKRGQVVLLRGENGSGKTTLLNILSGLLRPDEGALEYRAAGSLKFTFRRGGRSGANFAPERLAGARLARTWQEVRLFRTLTLRENIACADPDNAGERMGVALFDRAALKRDEARASAAALASLDRFGLGERHDALPSEISLGQSKRVAVGRALAGGGQILLLDEPLAGLDGPGAAKTLEVLRDLVVRDGLTLIIVEHALNQPLIRPLITHEWLLQDGRLVQTPGDAGPAAPSRGSASSDGVPAWAHAIAQTGTAAVEGVGRGGSIVRLRRNTTSAAPLLRLIQPEIHRGGRTVFGDARDAVALPEIALHCGEIVFLEAPNGWGKTTLLSALIGDLPLAKGFIEVGGRRLPRAVPHRMREAGIVSVSATDNAHLELTVSESLALVGAPRKGDLISGLPLHRKVSSLSGGERQRLALWCALTGRPNASVFLLDEPLAFLDEPAIRTFASLVAERADAAFLIAMPASRTPEREISQ